MNEIIIIGNGTSVLEKENGKLIDSYENVVRFNAYKIKSYEKYIGEKTNIWFNVLPLKMLYPRDTKYEKIYIHSWISDPEKDKIYQQFKAKYKTENTEILKTSKKECFELEKFLGERYQAGFPTFSTGIVAIWMMCKLYEKVTITGFDWWERDKNHFYDNEPKAKRHNPFLEKKIIDKLISQKKVEMI
jgi:hypothetical protein